MQKNEPKIVYRVFDNLENLLCKYINTVDNSKQVGIVINAFDFEYFNKGENVYELGVEIIDSSYTDSIFRRSNRVMSICGKVYPVYFLKIDNVFLLKEWERNLIYDDSSLRKNLLYYIPKVRVDMGKKKILYSNMYQYIK